jgi:hypothetical protein
MVYFYDVFNIIWIFTLCIYQFISIRREKKKEDREEEDNIF